MSELAKGLRREGARGVGSGGGDGVGVRADAESRMDSYTFQGHFVGEKKRSES